MVRTKAFVACFTLVLSLTWSQHAFAQYQYQFVRSIGSSGSGDGQLKGPYGIAIDAVGNLFVADYGNNRVEKFSSQGSYLGQINGVYQAQAVAVDQSGNVYAAEYRNNTVGKYSNDCSFLSQVGGSFYFMPNGLATDSLEDVLISGGGNGIQKFDENGVFVTNLRGATGAMALDQADNLFVAEFWGYDVVELDRNGNYVTNFSQGIIGHPTGIALDPLGDILVTDAGYGNRVDVFSSSGGYLTSFPVFGVPEGVAIDKSGNVYVVDWSGNSIDVYRPVPEPSTFALLVVCAVALFGFVWRRRKRRLNDHANIDNAAIVIPTRCHRPIVE
jgi:tripartite motif-containing protein 71